MRGSTYPRPYYKVDDKGQRRVPKGATWTYAFETTTDGKRKRISKGGFRTRKEADAALAGALEAFRLGEHVEPSKMTLGKFLVDEWLPMQASSKKPSTYGGYRNIVEKRLVPALGDVRLTELSSGRVAAFYASMAATGGRNGKPLSSTTVKHTHAVLHRALETAASQRLIVRNPLRDLDRDARPRTATAGNGREEMKYWDAGQLGRFLDAVDGNRWGPVFHLAAMTGLRRGEVLGLRWADVDLEAGRLSIRNTRVAVGYEVHEGAPKTRSSVRTVDLDADTVSVLRTWRRHQLEERLAAGGGYTDSGYVVVDEVGKPIHPQTMTWHFDRAVREAGVDRIRFHDLRHTHATILLALGEHPKVVQERLGHSSIAITLDLYSHVTPGMQATAAAAIGDALRAARAV